MGLMAFSLCSRRDLLLEVLALRQPLTVLKRRRCRPRLTTADRVFWMMLRRFWSGWKRTLVIVQPDTVVGWHRTGFKLYWTWCSQHKTRAGRKRVSRELRELIFRIVGENPRWGARRVYMGS
jgi:putative transposase